MSLREACASSAGTMPARARNHIFDDKFFVDTISFDQIFVEQDIKIVLKNSVFDRFIIRQCDFWKRPVVKISFKQYSALCGTLSTVIIVEIMKRTIF